MYEYIPYFLQMWGVFLVKDLYFYLTVKKFTDMYKHFLVQLILLTLILQQQHIFSIDQQWLGVLNSTLQSVPQGTMQQETGKIVVEKCVFYDIQGLQKHPDNAVQVLTLVSLCNMYVSNKLGRIPKGENSWHCASQHTSSDSFFSVFCLFCFKNDFFSYEAPKDSMYLQFVNLGQFKKEYLC